MVRRYADLPVVHLSEHVDRLAGLRLAASAGVAPNGLRAGNEKI